MAIDGLTGSRIRERRQINGLRQADLARQIGISASYLNLIEHNRRRIGGKLLLQIAEALGVESAHLSEGAEAALISALREAEAGAGLPGVELERIEEFAGRFPGWARLLAATHARVGQLEQTVDGLNDRLNHDPALASAVHEVLSTAASIRSTASILAETDALEQEWLDRFHTNINTDSARLADSSRLLAGYLEQGPSAREDGPKLPQEEVDEWLTAREYHVAELEDETMSAAQIVSASDLSPTAGMILHVVLDGYAADARALKASVLSRAIEAAGHVDPVVLSQTLRAPVGLVLRRMACLPELGAGYVLADRSGSLILRKGTAGFALPRFGASCPLWPVFQALSQPGTVIHRVVEQVGRRQAKFDCYAVTEPVGQAGYNEVALLRSGMLILPNSAPGAAELEVGASCRICPKDNCPGRREPSVLSDVA
ncbi:XRE family transcriptional regulator [Aliishimia ponticola]|uniref:XRE family transcriptional regulator n=1 Tax=Aliishimia ponticola TaxID=2499833 RepID=A0A4S4NHD9_9RHOB|nr:helix-turn-helix transcriptional regulator [Aliishimia ponticola]THH38077.1 XRE family transcriptional regulator [Aliishimia ponticola]